MSNVPTNPLADGQMGSQIPPQLSASGNRVQPQQIMLVPASRQQQVVYQQQLQHQTPPQQQFILQQGGFDASQHTYQVIHPSTGQTVQLLGASSVGQLSSSGSALGQPLQTFLQPSTLPSVSSASSNVAGSTSSPLNIIKCPPLAYTTSTTASMTSQGVILTSPAQIGGPTLASGNANPPHLIQQQHPQQIMSQQQPSAVKDSSSSIASSSSGKVVLQPVSHISQQQPQNRPVTQRQVPSASVRPIPTSSAASGISSLQTYGKQIQVLSPQTGTWSPVVNNSALGGSGVTPNIVAINAVSSALTSSSISTFNVSKPTNTVKPANMKFISAQQHLQQQQLLQQKSQHQPQFMYQHQLQTQFVQQQQQQQQQLVAKNPVQVQQQQPTKISSIRLVPSSSLSSLSSSPTVVKTPLDTSRMVGGATSDRRLLIDDDNAACHIEGISSRLEPPFKILRPSTGPSSPLLQHRTSSFGTTQQQQQQQQQQQMTSSSTTDVSEAMIESFVLDVASNGSFSQQSTTASALPLATVSSTSSSASSSTAFVASFLDELSTAAPAPTTIALTKTELSSSNVTTTNPASVSTTSTLTTMMTGSDLSSSSSSFIADTPPSSSSMVEVVTTSSEGMTTTTSTAHSGKVQRGEEDDGAYPHQDVRMADSDDVFSQGVVETTVESGCGFEDVTTLMEWNSEGVASLPGSDIKFTINEFGMLEMVDLNRTLTTVGDKKVEGQELATEEEVVIEESAGVLNNEWMLVDGGVSVGVTGLTGADLDKSLLQEPSDALATSSSSSTTLSAVPKIEIAEKDENFLTTGQIVTPIASGDLSSSSEALIAMNSQLRGVADTWMGMKLQPSEGSSIGILSTESTAGTLDLAMATEEASTMATTATTMTMRTAVSSSLPESSSFKVDASSTLTSSSSSSSSPTTENDFCQCAVCGCYGMKVEFLTVEQADANLNNENLDGLRRDVERWRNFFFCSLACRDKRDSANVKKSIDESAKNDPMSIPSAMEYRITPSTAIAAAVKTDVSSSSLSTSAAVSGVTDSLSPSPETVENEMDATEAAPTVPVSISCQMPVDGSTDLTASRQVESPLPLPSRMKLSSASPTPSLVSNDSNLESASLSSVSTTGSSAASAASATSNSRSRQTIAADFPWNLYIESESSKVSTFPASSSTVIRLAPTKLFKNHYDGEAFPPLKNGFKVGMRLEAIDPKHQSLFCVVNVAEVRACRLRLHFEGYPDKHDFWVNCDSPDLFPLGWSEKNGKNLHQRTKDAAPSTSMAPKALFPNLRRERKEKALTPMGFRIGMKLEALDPLSPDRDVCVATIADVLPHDNRFLVHLDGRDVRHDFWAEPTCPHVHPVDWCKSSGNKLVTPLDLGSDFEWTSYLSTSSSLPVPARAFKIRPASGFRVGMKLEAVDPLNPILVRVASVVQIVVGRLKIHFDGWTNDYDFWVDETSPDIHPPGWCAKTGHPLQPPVNMSESPTPTSSANTSEPADNNRGEDDDDDGISDAAANAISGGASGSLPSASSSANSSTSVAGAEYCPTPGCKGLGHLNNWHDRHYNIVNCPYFKLNRDRSSATWEEEEDRITGNLVLTVPRYRIGKHATGVTGAAASVAEGNVKNDQVFGTPSAIGTRVVTPQRRVNLSGDPTQQPHGAAGTAVATAADAAAPLTNGTFSAHVNGEEVLVNGAARNGSVSPALSMPSLARSNRHGPPTPPPETTGSLYVPPGGPAAGAVAAAAFGLHRPADVVAASIRHSVFSPPFLPPPAPDVPLCWQHQSNLLPGVSTISKSSGHEAISRWTPSDVSAFVSNIPGCEAYGAAFEEEAVDGEALMLLHQDDIVNFLKIKLGPAVKIYNAIVILKNRGEIPPPPLPCIYRLNCDSAN